MMQGDGGKGAVRCTLCDVILEGRDQYIGHMIHGHDMPDAHAEESWRRRRPAPGLHAAPPPCMPDSHCIGA
jgi:hypothetical protein